MRRTFFYRPLAALLAAMTLPAFSPRLAVVSAAGRSGGIEQVGGCVADPSSPAIIRQYCVDGIVYASDLLQLERDAVSMYLAEHGIPSEDAHVVYDFGRTDVRSAVRANILLLLNGIITSPRTTAHQQNLYNWLAALIKKNEIALYTNALNQFNSWQADPCHFTLDPTIASIYGLSYDGSFFCGSPLNSLFGGPPVPAESYFTVYGMRKSYAALSDSYPNFSALMAQTSLNLAEIAGITGAVSAVAVWAGGAALAANLIAATTIAAESAAVVSAATVSTFGTALLVAGPVAIVVVAIAVGLAAGLQAFTRQAMIDNLNNLNAKLTQAKAGPPDLLAFVNDTSGLGSYKIQMTVVSQTAPEVASTSALPAHGDTDLDFALTPSTNLAAHTVTDTLTYRNWDGDTGTVRTWGGWFVKTCAGARCGLAESISGSFGYVDWAGVKWTASRLGDQIVSTKAVPAATDTKCEADQTGTSPGTDFSHCRSYISKSIPVTDGNGNFVRASLSSWSAPEFTEIVSLPFNPGFSSSRTIRVSGNPTPFICPASGSLPENFSMNGDACGQGSFTITYDGSLHDQGRYPIALVATNGIGSPVTKQFTVDFSPQLAVTSPDTLVIKAGFPVKFTISATGNPTPAISLSPLLNLASWNLAFVDNGDGTATISGTPQQPMGIGACFHQGGAPCGIIATNSQGTIERQLNFQVSASPSATLIAPPTPVFATGTANSVVLRNFGAVTPVSFVLEPNALDPQPPAWLALRDLGDGTAVLEGTPPPGTSGPIDMRISVIALGSLESVIRHPFDYQIVVGDRPVFTSPNTATFTTGVSDQFSVAASQGTISLSGALPQGLTFTAGNPAVISGTPAAGVGGSYGVTLTADAGAAGTAIQSLQLNVNAPPKITSSPTATLFSGSDAFLTIATVGYPSTSLLPVGPVTSAPTDPFLGGGMFFTVSGLPSTLSSTNLNTLGFATGGLTISGTAPPPGLYSVVVSATNAVGTTATQTVALNVVNITAPAPASAKTCNGTYDGTFVGNLVVTTGQSCRFVSGGVKGNVQVTGGSFTVEKADITGNVSVSGNAAFAIGDGSRIRGNLNILNVSSAGTANRVCGATVNGNLTVSTNAAAASIGSADVVSCPGNSVGGGVSVTGNTGATSVYNNLVGKSLACSANSTLTGGGNAATKKNGQCAGF